MKLTDFLLGLNRHVTYYPDLTQITGSVTATLLLCHLAGWTGSQKDPDGWIYKTGEEFWDELKLGRFELEGARKRLRHIGFLHEKLQGIPARLYYRLDLDRINDAWQQQSSLLETSNPVCGKPANKVDGFPQTIPYPTSDPTSNSSLALAGANAKGVRAVAKATKARRRLPEEIAQHRGMAFARLWESYGKVGSVVAAAKAWDAIMPDQEMIAEWERVIPIHRSAFRWGQEGGRIQKDFSTWLNNSCWLDEPPKKSTNGGGSGDVQEAQRRAQASRIEQARAILGDLAGTASARSMGRG